MARSGSWPASRIFSGGRTSRAELISSRKSVSASPSNRWASSKTSSKRAFGAFGAFQDLLVEPFLAAPRRLAQLRDDQLQQARRRQMA